MSKRYALESTPSGWQFKSETALEDFVWDHLEALFGYEPLRRQHHVEGNYCDILAIAPTRQLVIIELKNAEDRYVVQQLTRYYHKLQQVKPFSDCVDYHQPIMLMALSPQLHEDNAIDVLYHRLEFKLIAFEILQSEGNTLLFQCVTPDAQLKSSVPIPFSLRESELKSDIPAIPRTFRNALAKCESHDPNIVLEFREKIFDLDDRIKEVKVENSYFIYGKGKTKPVVSIAFTSNKWGSRIVHHPHVSFWLPISIHWSHRQERLSPLLVNDLIFLSDKSVAEETSELESILSARLFKKKKPTSFYVGEQWTVHKYLSDFIEKELMEHVSHQDIEGLKQKTEAYCALKSMPNPLRSHQSCLDFFVQLALQCWHRRI
ncbi:MAG: endonuclease NucS domain-containing protein [Leptolyngbya sp.]|nr:endonuclease NucS domain-containing protein [Leptolyngbya sp.]